MGYLACFLLSTGQLPHHARPHHTKSWTFLLILCSCSNAEKSKKEEKKSVFSCRIWSPHYCSSAALYKIYDGRGGISYHLCRELAFLLAGPRRLAGVGNISCCDSGRPVPNALIQSHNIYWRLKPQDQEPLSLAPPNSYIIQTSLVWVLQAAVVMYWDKIAATWGSSTTIRNAIREKNQREKSNGNACRYPRKSSLLVASEYSHAHVEGNWRP